MTGLLAPLHVAANNDPGDGFVQSVARGLAVLRAFKPGQEKLTMAQVATACGLTRAGARRILLTHESLGYVGVDGRLFYLTSKVLELSKGYLAQTLWDKVTPVLQILADDLGETVSAGVLEEYDVVYTVRVRSSRVLQLDLSAGAHLPAYVSSMGRVLLADLPPTQLASYLRSVQLVAYTGATVTDRTVLAERIEETRRQGWSYVGGEIDEANCGVSVPLRDSEGRTLAALNVSLRTASTSEELVRQRIVPMLQAAALRITGQL